jgi:hypothetical protein
MARAADGHRVESTDNASLHLASTHAVAEDLCFEW